MNSVAEPEILLAVQDLAKYFPLDSGGFKKSTAKVHAVDGVSFHLNRGEALGLVGESGCGKTTLGRVILKLTEPSAGRLEFAGEDITAFRPREMRPLRRRMQMIFQDPYASLNPRMTVGNIIGEAFTIHKLAAGAERRRRVEKLLSEVGLPLEAYNKYPHEFSGGQRQRVGIARALAVKPELIIADEPVSALDVSIQAQIINLLTDLQREYRLTYILISHDLKVVQHLSNRVGVMYLGKIVELTPARELYARPLHPYTQALLSAVPIADPERHRKRLILSGDVPSPIAPPPGCRFHPRCSSAMEVCKREEPKLNEITPRHYAACHLVKPEVR